MARLTDRPTSTGLVYRMKEILYFTAAWCGPCKAMKPIIAELQAEGHKITKIDVDQDRNKANLYRVSAMPTFVVLKDGSEQRRFIGARNKAALLAELEG